MRRIALLVLAATLGGCAFWRPAPPARDDAPFARSVAETATVAAVARPGARVCREMQVGIAERDWVRGVVVEAQGSRVTVRIDEPGRFGHTIGGDAVVRGSTVKDDATAWTPCL